MNILRDNGMRHMLILLSVVLFNIQMTAAQVIEVQGTVVQQSTDQPIVGASVIEKGTTNGTTTSSNGTFFLKVKPGARLTVSFVGYLTQEVAASQGVKVSLAENSMNIDEVVVTGYSSERRGDITGAVSVVKMKDITGVPSTNPMVALQGRVAGMDVSVDGTPGDINTGVLIRGITSINDTSPLYVIDGVPTFRNLSTILNANDIESIQVLKDASSASIYGTQAANGVIVITTKRAKTDQLTVNFDAQLSLQTFYTGTPMLNAREWGEVYWKAYKNDGLTPSHSIYGSGPEPLIPEFIDENHTIPAADTNWSDEVYQNSLRQSYNVSVSRGSDKGSTTFSLNYLDHDGIIKYSNFTRLTGRASGDYSLLKNRLRIGENLSFTRYHENHKPNGIEELAIAQHPIVPVYDINGGYGGSTQGIGAQENPVRLLNTARDQRLGRWQVFGNAYAEAEPIKGLVVRTNFGINYYNATDYIFSPKWKEGDKQSEVNSLQTTMGMSYDWVWSNTINYNRTIGVHTFGILAGMESKEHYEEALWGRKEGFAIEDIDYRYLDAGEGNATTGNGASTYYMVSYFGKINYSLMDRYLISATLRRDASSRFGKNNNAALFPAVSAGWRISKENFMSKVSWVNELKLRASWGVTGNDRIDNEATYNKYSISIADSYDIAGANRGTIPVGVIRLRTGNPNLKWETTTQTNIGLDMELFRNRFVLSVDYFIKDTKDMLIDRTYSAVVGEGSVMAYNGASMENRGFDLTATWRDRKRNFSYELTFTAASYRNKITYFPEDDGRSGLIGMSLGAIYGYKTNGLYRTYEELADGIYKAGKGLGRIRYVDTNGDKQITEADRVYLGTNLIRFSGGLNVALSWKNFDLSFFLRGIVRDVYNSAKFYTDFFQGMTSSHGKNLLNAWDPDKNFNSSVPALTTLNQNNEMESSDYFFEDGSFIRMKDFQIGYTLPKRFSSAMRMTNMRIYFQMQNMFTLTNYSGADPESPGYPYPIPRTYTWGISFGF
ncbi:SusC/RagA family TonB-linked outer membrane protein [Alistipes senegalensis]|uniref:SusC/RagA family TonB-linked outer membrane protein n=1 Tax=Alistipes senegalensis TaxID=1288121 RepID=UPI001E4FAFE5|nr:TonB-dependent receptor [Alistipes senegalensis]